MTLKLPQIYLKVIQAIKNVKKSDMLIIYGQNAKSVTKRINQLF